MKNYIFRSILTALIFLNAFNLFSAPKDLVKKGDLNQSYMGFSLQTESGVIEGKFKLKNCTMDYTDTILISYEIVADLNSMQITQTDTKLSEAQIKKVLCSAGFFNCDSFPEAKIVNKRLDRKPNDSYFTVANLTFNKRPIEVKFVIAMNKFDKNDGFFTIFYVDRQHNKIKYIPQDKSDPINDKYFFDNLELNLYIILSKK